MSRAEMALAPEMQKAACGGEWDSDASPQIPGAGGWWVWSQGAGVWTVRLELLGGSGVSLCIRLLVV